MDPDVFPECPGRCPNPINSTHDLCAPGQNLTYDEQVQKSYDRVYFSGYQDASVGYKAACYNGSDMHKSGMLVLCGDMYSKITS